MARPRIPVPEDAACPGRWSLTCWLARRRPAACRLRAPACSSCPSGDGHGGGLAFCIVRVEAWASGPSPATTPAESFRSDCTLGLRDDPAGPRRSLLDWCRVVLRAG